MRKTRHESSPQAGCSGCKTYGLVVSQLCSTAELLTGRGAEAVERQQRFLENFCRRRLGLYDIDQLREYIYTRYYKYIYIYKRYTLYYVLYIYTKYHIRHTLTFWE